MMTSLLLFLQDTITTGEYIITMDYIIITMGDYIIITMGDCIITMWDYIITMEVSTVLGGPAHCLGSVGTGGDADWD